LANFIAFLGHLTQVIQFCHNTIVNPGLGLVILVIVVPGAEVKPLIHRQKFNDIFLKTFITVERLETAQIVMGDKPRAKIEEIVTGFVKVFNVLDGLNDIVND